MKPINFLNPRKKAAAVVGVVLVGLTAAVWLLVGNRKSPVPESSGTPFTFQTIVAPRGHSPVPVRTVIAEVTGPVRYFDRPRGVEVGELPMGSWWKDTKSLPVVEQRSGWLLVRLPERPNGSTGWIRASDAVLSDTDYGILIDTSQRRVQLFDSGELIVDAPAGVGTVDDPTPLGEFYVMDVAPPPGPGWGPFVLDTNAHSETIQSWQGTGDAFTAIHGPLGMAELIGTDGAAISHGCVRLHEEDLKQFSVVPPGTPVVIV